MSEGTEITLREVFDAVQEIRRTLAGMQSHTEDLKDHETRLRALERSVWRWAGAAGVGGAALSFVASRMLGG